MTTSRIAGDPAFVHWVPKALGVGPSRQPVARPTHEHTSQQAPRKAGHSRQAPHKGGTDPARRKARRSRTKETERRGATLTGNKWGLRALQAAVLAGLIALWWAVTRFTSINPVILPSPQDVGRQLVDTNICRSMGEGSARRSCGVQGYFLWQHLVATLQRIAVGLGAGIVVGVALGWLLASRRAVRSVVEPYISFMRALPPLGYIGLLIVWFGIGDTSKVILLFLATFPAVTVATVSGVLGVRQDWVRAAQSLGASRFDVIRRVSIPGALPEILSGVRLANGMAWSAIIAAELNDGVPGIGGLAFISGTQLNTSLTIACIIVIGVIAVAMDQIFLLVERRCAPWRGKG